jgi:hypothetical protein
MKFKNIKKKAKKEKLPSNSRSIPASPQLQRGETEHLDSSSKSNSLKLLIIYKATLNIFVIIIFIITVIIVGLDLRDNMQEKQKVDLRRKALVRDLEFWENFISKNNNYRDAYFQASILEYRLGNTSRAKMHVEKGLLLDPLSIEGRKIEKFLK